MYIKISKIQRKILDMMYITTWSNKRRCISNEEYLYDNEIPFIYLSASRLAISGFINTIDGFYEQYIISVHDIVLKLKNKKYLIDEINYRKIKKRNENYLILLYQWNNLPTILNNKIINYFNKNYK